MSLDVSLYGPEIETKCTCPNCDNEHTHKKRECYFSANITHNLGRMAEAAGVYDCCWRPDECGITKAIQLSEPLRKGIADMEARPEEFKKFNSENGWGLYENFLPWLKRYLAACEANPDANVSVSR